MLMKVEAELERYGASTRVTQQMSYKLKIGPLGGLMNALVMRRKLDRGIRDVFAFAELKRFVETSTRSGTGEPPGGENVDQKSFAI